MFFSSRSRRAHTKRPAFRHVKLCLEPLEERLAPATLTVTGIGDTIAADGMVTLREAITSANNNASVNADVVAVGAYGADTIHFNIPGAGVQTIAPLSALPEITDAVTIDGTSQPGFSSSPIIELTGAGAGPTASGLVISADNSTVRGMVINGFGVAGILIITGNDNLVQGNYLGTNAAGTAAAGNGTHGVYMIDASNNRVEGNVISGNGPAADPQGTATVGVAILQLTGRADFNTVADNRIGTSADGAALIPNVNGLFIGGGAQFNTVEGNLISGNKWFGVQIAGDVGQHQETVTSSNVVRDNTITGNNDGIELIAGPGKVFEVGLWSFTETTLGTKFNTIEDNNISGNRNYGLVIDGIRADSNFVYRNTITNNSNAGVAITGGAQDNTIGGVEAQANVIADNGGAGVMVRDLGVDFFSGADFFIANNLGLTPSTGQTSIIHAVGNEIRGNSIHDNGGLGIDLGDDGFTLNDALDADAGPNGLQNFPVIISTTPGATTQIVGRFHSRPNTIYVLDFYASASVDPSGFGEGQRHLGTASVTTDAAGDVRFTIVVGASAAGEAISATASDPDGNTSEFSGNRAPTASAGGPYIISEGQGITLDASASSDPDFDVLTYSWDINGDGVFGDAVGVQPTLTWSQLNSLGINDGLQQFSVRVRVDDDAGHVVTSPATTLTVTNAIPTASIAGPADGVRGQMRTFTLSATDPSSVDQSAGFIYAINWGDGSPQQTVGRTPGNGGGVAVGHVFAEIGTYTITVTAADEDGGVSAAVSFTIEITVLAIQMDPCDSTRTALVVGGTSDNDTMVFNPGSGPGDVQVILNGVSLGTFSPTGAIIAYGREGNDNIQVAGSITQTAWLYGDAGNDRLAGGGGPSILLGGIGDDQLMGGSDRDLMIGGLGADQLVGNGADDILIGGITAFDDDVEALCAIMDEWTSDRDYATRVANLKGAGSGPRANGDYVLKTDGADRTLIDDATADRLIGSSGKDWIFANIDGGVLDDVSGLLQSELVEDID